MGIVYLAEARGPGGFEKLVVVKELKRELADDPVYTAMFLDEARLAARLSHRHIVQTNEVGCEDGRYFMTLELLEGGSLQQIRKKLGVPAMPRNMSVRVLAAVLDALDHAHELTDDEGSSLDVVHRDVSPQNVFLTFEGDVKLIDFGVAKSKGRGGAAVTQVGVVKGSIPYMSPDHVDGTIIDRRADVFAVGVILREMLTGERLWGDADDLTILRSLIARDLPAFPESADVPAALRAIAERAMAPKSDDRFATAAAMRDELTAYLAESDPRGSLADLGGWLGRTLSVERAAFREIVRKGRAASAETVPGMKAAQVWLPSCELLTRYSGPPVLPAAPPPLPPAAMPRPSLWRFLGAGVAFVAAVAFVGMNLAHPSLASHAEAHPIPTSLTDRLPRVVEGNVTVSTNTSVAAEAPKSPEVLPDPESAGATLEPSSTAQVPPAVLHEPIPPNPYDSAQ